MKSIRQIGLSIILAFTVLLVLMLAMATASTGQPEINYTVQLNAPMMISGTRATLPVTQVVRSGGGVTVTLTDIDIDGHKFSNNGYVFFEITNSFTDVVTATFITPGTVDGLAIEDLAISVQTSVTKLIGPFPPSQYNQPSGADAGYVYVNYTSTTTPTSVTVGAFRLQ